MFRSHEDALKEAETAIKSKQSAYLTAEEARIATEKARVEARVEKGTLTNTTAIRKFEAIGEAPKSASGSIGKISTRTDPHFRIVNEAIIPREFLAPDLRKIGEVCKRDRAQMNIEGVAYYEEKVIIAR